MVSPAPLFWSIRIAVGAEYSGALTPARRLCVPIDGEDGVRSRLVWLTLTVVLAAHAGLGVSRDFREDLLSGRSEVKRAQLD